MSRSERVLIVEDEEPLADLFAAWFEDEYEVYVAYSGESALARLENDVDYVLLDRRMPARSGDEVLESIRSSEVDVRVAMVTAVESDYDIIEMGFDDYVIKPVSRAELFSLIERLRSLDSYGDLIRRMYQLASKKAALETSKSGAELSDNQEYQRLVTEFDRIKRAADERAEDLSVRAGAFNALER